MADKIAFYLLMVASAAVSSWLINILARLVVPAFRETAVSLTAAFVLSIFAAVWFLAVVDAGD